MWPFKKKNDETKPEYNFDQKLIEDLKQWRKIGQTFNYLGRVCVVTGYSRSIALDFYDIAELHADYADEFGVIHHISFSAAESRAFMVSDI